MGAPIVETIMLVLYGVVLVVLNACWLFLVVLGLPGTWLMVLTTALLAWWQGGLFSVYTLIVLALLALIGEVIEFFAGVAGTRQAGGSRWSAVGAVIGGLIGGIVGTGAIPIPLVGSLIGACAGAAIGAFSIELTGGRTMDEAVRSGLGAGKGRFFGTVAKLGIGAVIWLVAAVAVFWP